jgi:hypothetical protein
MVTMTFSIKQEDFGADSLWILERISTKSMRALLTIISLVLDTVWYAVLFFSDAKLKWNLNFIEFSNMTY